MLVAAGSSVRLLTESVLLSVAGGALGILLARTGVEALVRAYPASLPRIGEAAVDLRVMLVSLALALVCGLLFGLVPMLTCQCSGRLRGSLQIGPTRIERDDPPPRSCVLVMAETALAVIVVVGAGLLLRTVHNLTAVDEGSIDRVC